MRIAVLENLRVNAPRTEQDSPDAWAELGTIEDVQEIVVALERAGHQAAFFEGGLKLLEELPAYRPDLCFNLCEGHYGEGRECHVPALLELMRLPYTGSNLLTLALTLDKPLTQHLLASHGLSTAPNQRFESPDQALDPRLRFPLFVKPAREGSSKGVTQDSVVWDEAQLRRQVGRVIATYHQPALVERFIRGREVTIGVLGNRPRPGEPDPGLSALPGFEIGFGGDPDGVYTHRIKSEIPEGWASGRNWHCPAPVPPEIAEELARQARAAFLHTGCRDYARIDFRLDVEDGLRPYILEVNALPGIFRDWSDIVFSAAAAGLSYDDFIASIADHAARRWRIATSP